MPRTPPYATTFEDDFESVGHTYARNFIVTNRCRVLKTDRGPREVARTWLLAAVEEWAEAHPGADKSLTERLRAMREEASGRPTPVGLASGRVGSNVRAVGRLFRLTRAERAVIQFKLATLLVPSICEAVESEGRMPNGGVVSLIAAVTGEAVASVERALEPDGKLATYNLVLVESGTQAVTEKITFIPPVTDLLTSSRVTRRRFADIWIPAAPPATLGISDYAHMGQIVARLEAILSAALDRSERGVNILLHGPPGTGKTQLARLLAQQVGADLRMAGTRRGLSVYRGDASRLASLMTGQEVLAGTRSLVLFDEMEDLFEARTFGGRSPLKTSKESLNSHLEENQVPVIWITNATRSMDPAILRRFTVVVEVPPLDEARRRAFWLREVGDDLQPGEAARLAHRFEVSPAQISGAVRAARLAGRGRAEVPVIEEFLAGNVAATGVIVPPSSPLAIDYQTGILQASVDVDALAERLERAGPRAAATICLHGPPGTGKSEWVRHLAERMERPLHVRRVSDIESMWVGEAEKNVAAAFAQAEREGAVLLFDEADSFLLDRRTAQRRWELTLTNEFLQRLEATRGIVACTTNTYDALDPAVMRRFSVKVEFGYLEPGAAARLFAAAFEPHVGKLDDLASDRVTAQMEGIGDLTPGDFAAVVRRIPFLDAHPSVESLLTELALEIAARCGGVRRVAGFRSSAL